MAGFDNVFEEYEGNKNVTAADLLNKDPEIILIVGFSTVNENSVRNRRSIEKVSAVKENKIYSYNMVGMLRPTQSIVKAAKEVAKILGTTN